MFSCLNIFFSILKRKSVITLPVFFFSYLSLAAEPNLPHFKSPILDAAHFFDASTVRFVENELFRLRDQGGPQIQVFTVESLDGENIEQYAIKLMEQEQIGDSKKDDGLLFIISKADRKMRLEVGQGLEGSLPDVNAKRIIEDVIKPYFRQGDMNRGLIIGLQTITSQVAPDFKWSQDLPMPKKRKMVSSQKVSDALGVVFFIIIYILYSVFFRRGRSSLLGGPFIGGNSYGSGRGWGSSGGWGGGGGGFSGGGASGDW